MKIAIIVVGPESSGNHLCYALLKGLVSVPLPGDVQHEIHTEELLQARINENAGLPHIILQKSMPCNKEWWNIVDMVSILHKVGYQSRFILVTRNHHATCKSLMNRHAPDTIDEATGWIDKAWACIFSSLLSYQGIFMITSYESLCYEPVNTIHSICEWSGIHIDIEGIAQLIPESRNYKHF